MAAPQLPPAGSFLPGAGSNAAVTPQLESLLAVAKQLPGGAATTTLTLDTNAGGRVVPTGARHLVDTFGQAASGQLAHLSVTALGLGRRVRLGAASALRPITVLNAAGGIDQLLLEGGVAMALTSGELEVELAADGWHEVGREWGAQTVDQRAWLGLSAAASYPVATPAEVLAGTAPDRLMTPLGTRQAQVAPGWLQSLPVLAIPPRDVDWLLYSSGTALSRVAIGGGSNALLTGSLRLPFVVEASIVTSTATEFNHSLGGTPAVHFGVLKCVAPGGDGNFDLSTEITTSSLHTFATPTTVGYICQSPIVGPGGSQTLTPSSWHVVLRAYKG